MSLNGDVTVIRNGRSTSTVSIYNYPEHLNPFYEDDQHKRLRFWPVNKKGNEGRRNSFSLGGIKDMWAFKSFRTKKKSSTLGINKTSESPPLLRREYQIDSSNLFNSYDRRARYSSNDGDNFQRNATYRSSLQNVHSTQQDSSSGIGLNRNDQYRSTIQFGNRTQSTKQTLPVPQPRRYVYGGSVTPQPARNSEFGRGNSRDSLIRGSSQTSVSTNPFDSDNDEESERIESAGGAVSLAGKRTPRKKRRAPAPPIPIHSTNGILPSNRLSSDSNPQNRSHQTELRIEEDLNISNLTAEIESFVKTKNNETPEKEAKVSAVSKETPDIKDPPKTNGTVPKAKSILKTTQNTVTTKELKPKVIDTELRINEDVQVEEKPALPEKTRIQHVPRQGHHQQIGNVECIHVHVESPRSTPERDIINRVSSFKKESTTGDKITAKTSFTLASPPTNRREVPLNDAIKPKIKMEETMVINGENQTYENSRVRANHPSNGIVTEKIEPIKEPEHIENAPSVIKPPIATKPTIETKSKVNNFAIIHKPGRRAVLNSETEEIAVPTPRIVTTEKIVIKEVHTPVETSERTIAQTVEKKEENATPPITLNGNSHAADLNETKHDSTHVVFQAVEANVKVVPVPESRISLEKQPENPSNIAKAEKVIVTLKKENPSDSEESRVIETTKISSPITKKVTESQSQTAVIPLQIEEQPESLLRIEEPTTSASSIGPSSNLGVNPKQRTVLLSESREEFEALYRNRPSSHMEWKQSTLAPLEAHVPPEKRRSVKDIIESINRSQRLLHAAANKDLPELITTRSQPPPSYSEVVEENRLRVEDHSIDTNNDLSQTIKFLDETQREIERMLPSTSASVSQNSNAGPSHLSNHNNNDTDPDTQKPNNDEIFKKCRVKKEVYDYRETSPTSSNLDWNPVPKPKRSKNLTEHREH